MDFDEKTYQLIEKYLAGKMHGPELIDFEKKIESLPQLKDEIAINKELLAHFDEGHVVTKSDIELVQFLGGQEAEAFKAKLNVAQKKVNSSVKTETTKVRKLGMKPLAIAASLLLLVGVFFFINSNGNTPENIFASYDKPVEINLIQKGLDGMGLSNIQNLFNNQKYSETQNLLTPILDTLSKENPFWFDLSLTQGLSFLALDENEKAKNIFKDLKNSEFVDSPKANWYYILTLLKQGEKETTVQEINSYLNSGKKYKKKELQSILSELE